MLDEGTRIPDATVWTAPNEQTSLARLAADGPLLLVFYLFDWSAT